jgi:hypothetical protein
VGRARDRQEQGVKSEQCRMGAHTGRWPWQQMQSSACGQPYGAVKRAMGMQVGRFFFRETEKTKGGSLVGPGRREDAHPEHYRLIFLSTTTRKTG